jgi:hypothetical protein
MSARKRPELPVAATGQGKADLAESLALKAWQDH